MIKPLNKRIHVKPIEVKLSSVIHIPENADANVNPAPKKFIILAIGIEVSDMIVGETIIAAGFAGTKLSDGTRLMNSETDVLAVVEGGD